MAGSVVFNLENVENDSYNNDITQNPRNKCNLNLSFRKSSSYMQCFKRNPSKYLKARLYYLDIENYKMLM